MRDFKQKRLLPISKLFPSFITVMAICFGLTSIRYALNSQWDVAVAYIVIAGFLDVVDGRLARFLKATSDFGAQLDSLADFVNFGIAPAIVVYLWELHKVQIKGLGWALALFYSICSAIRLARFNSDLLDPDRPAWKEGFFKGVPAPMGGYLVLLPIMLSFECNILDYIHPLAIGIYMVVIGLLMASKLPTFATKKIIIHKEYISIILVLAGLVVGVIIMEPWISLSLLGLLYVCTFPFSMRSFKKMSKKENSNNI
jgi:CDP-diacylglycerol--serine O-phosphatidyltransferase